MLVTHNKQTMETADALFGVTMEEKGISKVVSMRFHSERHDAEMAKLEVGE